MGVKGFFHPKIGGGWLFLYARYISSRLSFAPASGLLRHSTRSKGHRIRAKSGKSEFFFGVPWCFLGKIGDQKGQNLNIFLKCGAGVSCRVLLWWWCFIVSTVCRWSALVARPAFVPCSPPFVRLSALPYCFAFQICPYFAF